MDKLKKQKRKKSYLVICSVAVMVTLSGCSHFSMFRELKQSADTAAENSKTEEERRQDGLKAIQEKYAGCEIPDAFTQKAVEDMSGLKPGKDMDVQNRGEAERGDGESTLSTEEQNNPFIVYCSMPDRYENAAGDLVNRYFFYAEEEKSDGLTVPEMFRMNYLEVGSVASVAGDQKEFLLECRVTLHVPDAANSVYTELGIVGVENTIITNLIIHGAQTSDYGFQLLDIANAQSVRNAYEQAGTPLPETDVSRIKTESLQENAYRARILADEGRLEVSYDGGSSWKQVPIAFDELYDRGDGTGIQTGQNLETASYIVSPAWTGFIYGGSNRDYGGKGVPITVMYSLDAGESWQTSEIEQADWGIRRSFLSYVDDTHLYALSCGGRTMHQEGFVLYKSSDSGRTWEKVENKTKDFNSISLATGFLFITPEIGFITVENMGDGATIYRTENGGKNWERQSLSGASKDDSVAYTPEYQDGILTVYLNPYGYGENSGTMSKMISEDQGKTWKFDGQVTR